MQERSEAERRAIWPYFNVATWRRERSDRAIQQIWSIFSDLCNPNSFSDMCNPYLFSDLWIAAVHSADQINSFSAGDKIHSERAIQFIVKFDWTKTHCKYMRTIEHVNKISSIKYYDNLISYAHIPLVPQMQERSDMPFGHASMLLLGEGSEATEPYNIC